MTKDETECASVHEKPDVVWNLLSARFWSGIAVGCGGPPKVPSVQVLDPEVLVESWSGHIGSHTSSPWGGGGVPDGP